MVDIPDELRKEIRSSGVPFHVNSEPADDAEERNRRAKMQLALAHRTRPRLLVPTLSLRRVSMQSEAAVGCAALLGFGRLRYRRAMT